MQKEEQRIKALQTGYDGARAALLALELSTAEKQRLAEIARIDAALQKPFKEALGQALAFDGEGAIKTIVTQIDPLNQAAMAEMDQLVTQSNAATGAVLTEAAGHDLHLKQITLLVSALAIAAGALFAWLITRTIAGPLHEAVLIAERVAEGDLTSQIEASGRDEITRLYAALRKMNDSLANQLAESASGVARRGGEVVAQVGHRPDGPDHAAERRAGRAGRGIGRGDGRGCARGGLPRQPFLFVAWRCTRANACCPSR